MYGLLLLLLRPTHGSDADVVVGHVDRKLNKMNMATNGYMVSYEG